MPVPEQAACARSIKTGQGEAACQENCPWFAIMDNLRGRTFGEVTSNAAETMMRQRLSEDAAEVAAAYATQGKFADYVMRARKDWEDNNPDEEGLILNDCAQVNSTSS